ncbi:MAG: ABC transporter permease subunit [Pseudomonadota bacterium]|nr:ABC transporter permease subunit [Pseudomonadota bacterium]
MSENSSQGSGSVNAIINDERYRSVFYQVVVFGLFIWAVFSLIENTQINMATRKMAVGFDFLKNSAGFAVAWTPLDYKPSDSYFMVYWVGIINTLILAGISIVLATLLGFVVGILRLSRNWLVAQIASWYVEILRNTPLLLQIIFWYLGAFANLPRPKQSIEIFGFETLVLNNRGLYIPKPQPEDLFWVTVAAFVIGLVVALVLNKRATKKQQETGKYISTLLPTLVAVFGLPIIAFLLTGMPLDWDLPALKGFNYRGGGFVLPAMLAVMVALVVYHSAYAAEMVRAGILSVNKGQTEAALSLGLKQSFVMRLVIIPQAMRAIVPPMISLWMNVVKNSSLAIAIGFPDLVSVFMQTSLNQSGHAVEIVAMVMAFYMTVSLTISACLNVYNKKIQLTER